MVVGGTPRTLFYGYATQAIRMFIHQLGEIAI